MHRRVLISKQENRYKTKGENNTGRIHKNKTTSNHKNEFDERWDKTTVIKKKLPKELYTLSNFCYYQEDIVVRISNFVDLIKQKGE